jgi:hypothetical protein
MIEFKLNGDIIIDGILLEDEEVSGSCDHESNHYYEAA